GRDLAIASMLGAEEWGIATSALVVEGCILMRKCHLNTCPVGVATQDENLRKKFTGKVDHVVNYFRFLAQDLREIMASLGIRTVDELVGRSDLLRPRSTRGHWKAETIDLSPLLFRYPTDPEITNYRSRTQNHGLDLVLDKSLIKSCKPALEYGKPVEVTSRIKNTNRATGAMLSSVIVRKFGARGLPMGAIKLNLRGSAGQSFAAFAAPGVVFRLEGDSNDYMCKGLSGAVVSVTPDRDSQFESENNIIVGNVALYGATSGEVYINGMAGERFAVRNSGVSAVVEGVGAHGCQYMTGGRVVVLGPVGRNFGSGMSGGLAFIYDPDKAALANVNAEMVDPELPGEEDFQLI
ncbi:MAG: glutamate synthase-related protein, partial [Saprospiraceae bacterium]|nr:glutamate synthase-related protein [Saprospiraceae bacterium]